MGIRISKKGRIPSCMIKDGTVSVNVHLDNSQNETPPLILYHGEGQEEKLSCNLYDLNRHKIQIDTKRPDKIVGLYVGKVSSSHYDMEKRSVYGCLACKCLLRDDKTLACARFTGTEDSLRCGKCNGPVVMFFPSIKDYTLLPEKAVKEILSIDCAISDLKDAKEEVLANLADIPPEPKKIFDALRKRGLYCPRKYFE